MPFQMCGAFCGTSEATAVHGKACGRSPQTTKYYRGGKL